jgi:hypothetical protein
MTRLAIAAGIYAVLIRRSPRDFAAASDGPALRQAIDALACTALELADVLIAADARVPAPVDRSQALAAAPRPAH